MDVLNYQRIVSEKKFGKKQKEKKISSFFIIILLVIFLSLFFLNTDAQVLVKAAPLINDLGINQGDYYG